MDNSKEQERAELHRTIWQISNDLRGTLDSWDFKQYVLGFLFYRFISENITNYINRKEWALGNELFDYTTMPDEQAEAWRVKTVEEKGLFILPSELFCNVRAKATTEPNLDITLMRVFKNIENSAKGTKSEVKVAGLFYDIDLNSNKFMSSANVKLVKLLDAIGNLDFSNGKQEFDENTIDVFGDAYEFLMDMYAANAGTSGGEFFTPQEVSELLAKLTIVGKKEINKVYDPTCGSGSLLLKYAKILGKDNVKGGFYGQELNPTSYNLARFNMFLHDINYEKFHIAHGDTLINPAHSDAQPFDAIVANPPYSISWDGKDNPLLVKDPRFAVAGALAPKSKADMAFVMHILAWLDPYGTAAIVSFPGVLYRNGAEQRIRKYLVDNNYVDAVIQLPADLFFNTTISTAILVLKKNKDNNDILFIDASEEYIRTKKNHLTEDNIKKILDAFTQRVNLDFFAKLVTNQEVAKNDYNLSVSRYVSQRNAKKEEFDIHKLNSELKEIIEKEDKLRKSIEEAIKEIEEMIKEVRYEP